MIPLVYGDSREEMQAAEKGGGGGCGASYTCFLFPFAYRPVADADPTRAGPCYAPVERTDARWTRRRRYFTRETAEVLFDRAQWFAVPQTQWEDWTYPRRFKAALCSGEVEVELAAPELVLFEWHRDEGVKGEPDLFQTGFLLLEAHFPPRQANPPMLEDLLLFNERFRYWRPPFPAFAERLRTACGPWGLPGASDQDSALMELYLERWLRLLELPLCSPGDGRHLRLFPREWGSRARGWWLQELQSSHRDLSDATGEHCLAYADSRAFTWTCALVNGGSGALPQPGKAAPAAACNRWRQMHALSLAVPPEGDTQGRVCALDLVRPADGQQQIKGGPHWLSAATAARRAYGVTQKRREFYARAAKAADLPPDFVNDLNDLSDFPDKGNLHHKVAVIYIDGNGFGSVREALDRPSKQEHWDNFLRDRRKDLLRALMKTLHKESDEWRSRDWMFFGRAAPDPGRSAQLRFETLLWGGDELMWVVPAWQGWRMLCFFYGHARWTYEARPLKHAAGLVFCHQDAPIHRIKGLAGDLCGLAKDAGRDANRVAYQVLESFDHTGDDLAAFRAGRLPPGADPHALIVPGDSLAAALDAMTRFKNAFPKRKLHEIVALTLGGRVEDAATLAAQTLGPLPGAAEALKAMRPSFCAGSDPRHPELWLHLLELWDYVD